ncbi:hypothetical protein R6Q59_013351 [Mikania micrantha]|uniref:Uncharacterized protein n=1 Tax=Mikania micrantha TaxID=192012 RepID=A0A5N6LNP8_9ASTR|nr:hypothetical protein E3N88_40786 [Mikania micrantha]
MSSLPELTGVFSSLASRIGTRNLETEIDDQSDDVLVAALNQILNLSEVPRVRVLDTALSLMCFTAPQVLESVIDCSVNTIVSVLSSSLDCKVLRSGKLEVLRVGVSISGHDYLEVMKSCADVLKQVNEHGILSSTLLHAVLRVAIMTTRFGYSMQLTPILNVQPTNEVIPVFSKLISYMPQEINLENQGLQTRLILWYLDPQNLVKDVSQILQDAVGRPFICLNEELYENIEWRSIIICLAFSPLMFLETRALLHRWFLLMGLASVLELGVELVSMVLDVLLRPMWWGLSAEIGSKLPFSYTYFLHKHQLFRILARPLSCVQFLELVHNIKNTVSHSRRKLKHVATTSMVDHKSAWAMAMNFPEWFYFAALLLCRVKFGDSNICGVNQDNQPLTSSFSANAAWYIAWILDPVDESVCGLLAEKLENLSSTLINKHVSSYEHKKLNKPKPNACQSLGIRSWLEEMEDLKTIDIKNNVMFRRIILGVLIGCSDAIEEEGYELLLHYVATGMLLQSAESQNVGLKHKRPHHEFFDKCNRKELVAGACIVFNLTDVAEKISDSIIETRAVAADIVCKLKLKVIGYLLKCVKRLLLFGINENSDILIKDLHRRMLRWRHQGKDVFHGYKDLDDTINVIACKLF